MARDETDFDKLLKETREWEARDRDRRKSFGMKDDEAMEPPSVASRAPTVTVEELRRRTRPDLEPKAGPGPAMQAPNPAAAIQAALKTGIRQAQAQRTTERARRKRGWGWIWLLIALYFVFKHFVRGH